MSDEQVFKVYLGNIPADVVLEEVRINGKPLPMSDAPERGIVISPVVLVNGSRAYELRLPFEDAVVHWTVRTQTQNRCELFNPDFEFSLFMNDHKDTAGLIIIILSAAAYDI